MKTKELSLHHIVRPSQKKDGKAPVVFMLHGYGSNEDDLFSFKNELSSELCIISVRAPLNIMPSAYAWYAINFDADAGKWTDLEQAKEALNSLVGFIDQAIEAYDLDKDTISLLGFSQGAILSYALALSYPEKIKNVVALSGYIETAILKSAYQENDFSSLNIYSSHGTEDQVIPVEWARKTPAILKALKVTFQFEEFPVGHGVTPQNFLSFKKWLDQKI